MLCQHIQAAFRRIHLLHTALPREFGSHAAQNALRELTLATAATVTSDYKNLGDYLLVKYLDGNIKKEADGKFERNPHGMPVQPEFGGYNQRYFKSIVDDAGERLRVVEPNQQ